MRRTFVVLSVCTVAVFAALLLGLTGVLRARLQREIRQGEAQAIHDVATMEVNQAETRLSSLNVPVTTADIFAAVLDSSRLHGVLAVQLFDPSGTLRDALPAVAPESGSADVWWPATLSTPEARYYRNGRLEQILGLPAEKDGAAESTPLLEVVVPLRRSSAGESLGIARYWIDGTAMKGEFERLDASLATQTGIVFLGGALLVALLLGWSYRRLMQTQRELLDRSADLVRANQELDFAAKTGALGTISAHLIHGLKNPLAGLEGFVSETGQGDDATGRGEARQTAVETARRLRAMVNDVVSVLRDETSGAAEYLVPAAEMLDAVKARAEPAAHTAGVTLQVSPAPEVQLVARTANLASLVLANLLTNAIEASPRSGAVRIDARANGNRIEFCVTDEGHGLPSPVRESLFRPVVSTKPGGGGMGLAISSRLARHAGGELTLLRSDAGGTAFQLTVPANHGPGV